MGRRAKYPSPELAVSHFTSAVSDASTQAKWGTRAAEGAGKLGDWFRMVLPGLYAKIATLPVEPKDPWVERSKPVGQYIKSKKAEYRKAKLRALAGIGSSPATPA